MPQSTLPTLCCINPDCPQPIQTWGNKFCQSCGSPLQLHGRYLPLARLGAGGFAVTYAVCDLRLQTEQVLKVLIATLPKAIELFEQEAQVLASLDHPGVPHVEPGNSFRVQISNPTRQLPCLVMEKINGQTLEDLLDRHPQGCPEAWVIDWLWQAIDILKVLHARQIIHRDLKPANLMLRQNGQLVLIDFGGAKQMRPLLPAAQPSSTRLVSPGYSPPEQIAGGGIQPASDFYALGRTMIHLLTGRYPAELEDPKTGELMWRSKVQVHPVLADLLDDLVRVNVRQRPPTAEAIQARLEPIAALTHPKAVSRQKAKAAIVQGIAAGGKLLTRLAIGLGRIVIGFLKALLDTLWSILLAVIGASLGTAIGFAIAYQTRLGTDLAFWLSQALGQALPGLQPGSNAGFLLYGLAGLGTAWGLVAARGFDQQRRVWISALMGILGYVIAWAVLQLTQPDGAIVGLSLFTALAPLLLTLGLGLSKHPLPYAIGAAIGMVACVMPIAALDAEVATNLWRLLSAPPAGWYSLVAYLSFFSLLAGLLGGWLGLCHYLVLPLLRWVRR